MVLEKRNYALNNVKNGTMINIENRNMSAINLDQFIKETSDLKFNSVRVEQTSLDKQNNNDNN